MTMLMDTYLWAIHHYANWRTGISLGLVLGVPMAVAYVASRLTRNRSS